MKKKSTDISENGKKIKLEIPHTGGRDKIYKPEYADMARKRIANEQAQRKLF